jgi:hypothetical protein
MKVVRHRLRQIDPILYPLNDDGLPGITVIIHGAGWDEAFATRPDPDDYHCWISRAQLAGRVYLLSWRSGFFSHNPLTRINNFHRIEDNGHRLGNNLKKILSKLPSLRSQKIRLIGHSLGAHVITTALVNDDWTDLKLCDVILMGAAIGEDDYEDYVPRQFWRRCVSQVRGRIVNCYSGYDLILWYRSLVRSPLQVLRSSQLECIGRSIASYSSRRVHNISFTGTLSDHRDHDYFSSFDRVMNRVYPTRKRSSDYQVQAICKCPWCDKTAMVNANCDDECPSCNITFEYRTSTESPYWTYEPQEIWCPRCGKATIVVQAPGQEQCLRCRAKIDFDRRGSHVMYYD